MLKVLFGWDGVGIGLVRLRYTPSLWKIFYLNLILYFCLHMFVVNACAPAGLL
jgi:hypothetical protein